MEREIRETQKHEIENCLYCDGYNYQCRTYIAQHNEICLWFDYVRNNLEQIVEIMRKRSHILENGPVKSIKPE